MAVRDPDAVQFDVDDRYRVSALLHAPHGAVACYVLAHGAAVGMRHRAMEDIAAGLAERDIATFRYQFPYMEQGLKRPDPPALCHATVRAAVAEAARLAPGLPLIAGGRSFGGRMTSQAQAILPLPGVRGLASSPSRCIPPAGRRMTELSTYSTCGFRCCSCRGRATPLRTWNTCSRFASGSARAPR